MRIAFEALSYCQVYCEAESLLTALWTMGFSVTEVYISKRRQCVIWCEVNVESVHQNNVHWVMWSEFFLKCRWQTREPYIFFSISVFTVNFKSNYCETCKWTFSNNIGGLPHPKHACWIYSSESQSEGLTKP